MSYNFRQIYNVAIEADIRGITTYTEEANEEKVTKIKNWIDREFGDIFECRIKKDYKNPAHRAIFIYFKGTNHGLYILFDSSAFYSDLGFVDNIESGTVTVEGFETGKAEIKLLIVKSKYGVIAGFYGESTGIASLARMIAINCGNKFVPILLGTGPDNNYGGDSMTKFTMLPRGITDKICLSKISLPFCDIPEGIYLSSGAPVGNCAIYTIGGCEDSFVELTNGTIRCSIAMKLEEPTAEDYANIEPLWYSDGAIVSPLGVLGTLSLDNSIDEGITGEIDVGNEVQEVPGDLPIKTGLTHYFDLTKGIIAGPLKNGVNGGEVLDIYCGDVVKQEDSATVITGNENNYARTNIEGAKTIYIIYKASQALNDWNRSVFGSGAIYNSAGNLLRIVSRNTGKITITGQSNDVISSISDLDYHVVCLTVDSGVYKLYIDGNYIGTKNGKLGTIAGLGYSVYGTDTYSHTHYRNSNTYYRFLGLYNTVHTDTEVTNMSNYLSNRFINGVI